MKRISVYLDEGLREGDLDDILIGLISIDEFESKIDSNSVVIGFYLNDSPPAKDLNRFIQNGAIPIIDSDISPAPNKEGFYVVFVEMPRNQDFPKHFIDLLRSLKNLVNIDKWSFKAHKVKGVKEVSEDNLRKYVRLEPIKEKNVVKKEEKVKEFFQDTYLDGLLLEGNALTLKSGRWIRTFNMIDFNTVNRLDEKYNISDKAFGFDDNGRLACNQLYEFLGKKNWLIYLIEDAIVIQHLSSNQLMLLEIPK